MSEPDSETERPAELNEDQLDEVAGGLPAVQKVREAAARMTCNTQSPGITDGASNIVAGDGSV